MEICDNCKEPFESDKLKTDNYNYGLKFCEECVVQHRKDGGTLFIESSLDE